MLQQLPPEVFLLIVGFLLPTCNFSIFFTSHYFKNLFDQYYKQICHEFLLSTTSFNIFDLLASDDDSFRTVLTILWKNTKLKKIREKKKHRHIEILYNGISSYMLKRFPKKYEDLVEKEYIGFLIPRMISADNIDPRESICGELMRLVYHDAHCYGDALMLHEGLYYYFTGKLESAITFTPLLQVPEHIKEMWRNIPKENIRNYIRLIALEDSDMFLSMMRNQIFYKRKEILDLDHNENLRLLFETLKEIDSQKFFNLIINECKKRKQLVNEVKRFWEINI